MTSAILPSLTHTANIYRQESKYEFLKLLRARQFSLATIGFPVIFYLLFGVFSRHAVSAIDMSKYLLASYSCFGMLGASLFGFGVGIATERGQGWLEVKQASPMPPLAYLLAKVFAAMAFSLIIALLLMIIGVTAGGVHIAPLQAARLLATLLLGAVPFCSMGMIIGLIAKSNAAAGVVNLIYLPLSFCSGLWMPLETLPKGLQHFATFLPTYHLAQLALHTVGFGQPGSMLKHWVVLAGFTMLCLGVSQLLFRSNEQRA
jgi:ABC-2 type transport system permease protein